MWLKEAGLVAAALLAVVIFGNLWFHFVEGILAKIKKVISREKDISPWHTLWEKDTKDTDDESLSSCRKTKQ